jgi:glycosyltransferase involved in cell wall biosynthesis
MSYKHSQLPKITVVTPSFMQAAYLEQTILSVLEQGYPNLEYIVVDGGSTDNSVSVIKKYADRIAWWVSENDEGQYHAIQKGFNHSTGAIMTWINADDILAPGALWHVSQVFQDYPEVYWLGGCTAHINEHGYCVLTQPQKSWSRLHYLQKDYKYIQQEGSFWRRSLWELAGKKIYPCVSLAGDLQLWMRFFEYKAYYLLDCPLGYFRLRNKNQKSLDHLEKYNEQAESLLAKMTMSTEEEILLRHFNNNKGNKSSLNTLFRFWFSKRGNSHVNTIVNTRLAYNRASDSFHL